MKTEKDKPEKSEKSAVKVTVGNKAAAKPASSSKPANSAAGARSSKVFDVMRPGKAPASPSSRPVVVGHQAGAEASQLSVSGIGGAAPRSLLDSHKKVSIPAGGAAAGASDVPASPDLDSSSGDAPATAQWASATHKTIQPLGKTDEAGKSETPGAPALPGDTEKLSDPDDPGPINLTDPASPTKASGDLNPKAVEDLGLQEDEAKLDEVAAEPEPEAPAPEPTPAPPAPAASTEPTPASPAPSALSQPANPAAANAPAASTAQAEHLLQDLTPEDMDEEHIVISHHAVHGAWKAVLALVIIILLAAVIVDILFDAGVIDSMGIPHTDFF